MFNEIANLCKTITVQDEYGNEKQTITKTEVFVEPKSIGMRENYLAAQVGLKPEVTLVLSDYRDYDDQRLVEYDGTMYTVTRTYRNGHELEITLARKQGNE